MDVISDGSFHSKCDGIGKTITFIRSNNGNIFGGFTSIPWEISGNWIKDPSAFIFSVDNQTKFRARNDD